jgi:hypothetical protein
MTLAAPSGPEPKALAVCSSTPPASPRQPAWAAATRWPASSVKSTGRQSATMIVQARPVAVAVQASAAVPSRTTGIASCAASSATTPVPCTC